MVAEFFGDWTLLDSDTLDTAPGSTIPAATGPATGPIAGATAQATGSIAVATGQTVGAVAATPMYPHFVTKDGTLSPAATADLEAYRDTWRELILMDAEGQDWPIHYKHEEEADMESLIAQGTCVPEAELWHSDEAAETKTCLVEWAGKDIGNRIQKNTKVIISSTHPTIDKEMDAEVLRKETIRRNDGACSIRLSLSVKVLPAKRSWRLDLEPQCATYYQLERAIFQILPHQFVRDYHGHHFS
jgi:hypothetical protein